jgi:hypothetical protein
VILRLFFDISDPRQEFQVSQEGKTLIGPLPVAKRQNRLELGSIAFLVQMLSLLRLEPIHQPLQRLHLGMSSGKLGLCVAERSFRYGSVMEQLSLLFRQ